MAKILIHDKDAVLCTRLGIVLAEAHHEVTALPALEDALEALCAGPLCNYDVLISENETLVKKLLDHRSGRFDSLSCVANTAATRSGGLRAVIADFNEVMKLRA